MALLLLSIGPGLVEWHIGPISPLSVHHFVCPSRFHIQTYCQVTSVFSSPELCSRWVIVTAFCPASGVHQLLLLSNQWVNWDETSQKASSQWPHQISFKFLRSMQNSGFHGNEMKKLQNSSSPKLFGRFSNNFVKMFLGWPSIRFLQAMLIGRKHGRQVGGIFCIIWL